MTSKDSYKIRARVASIIVHNGGIIFGGHVRDTILRDSHTNDYNIECIINGKDYTSNELFNDPTFYPEYKGRMVTSYDIDCYVPEHAVKHLIADLHSIHIKTYIVFDREDAKAYLPDMDIPNGILRHVRYMLFAFTSGFPSPFNIDMLIAKSNYFHMYYPPFGSVDFECNGLLMTATGITMSPQLYPQLSLITRHNRLDVILNDIRNMKAVYVDAENLTMRRISKMKAKGWDVEYRFIQTCASSSENDDICIICHDDAPKYKLMCCNARYHRDCLLHTMCGDSEFSMQRTMKCIMCKKYTRAFTEATILKSED